MRKKSFKKFLGSGIVLLFVISACTSLSGSNTKNIDTELTVYMPETNLVAQEAVVSCSTYGFREMDSEQKSTMNREDAELLLDMINEYTLLIAQDPYSPDAADLQQEIITLASEYGLVSQDILSQIEGMQLPKQRLMTSFLLGPQSRASEWFCNYAAAGEGSSSPVIILPRLIPILLTPIPRLFYRWSCKIGYSSCGGLRSGTGFMAVGEQTGRALGFWGIGFSIFLPPVMAFGIFGYALYCSVEADYIEYYPPNYPPEVNAVYPLDGAVNIPISTSELSCYIDDYENELMSYSVITNPDIGTGNGNLKPDGTYTVPISGLEGSETYSWTVQVSDGPNTVEETYTFSTEPVAPVVSNPTPEDGERYIPISLAQLRFRLTDFQGDSMDYTVETSPDIGSGGEVGVGDGYYTVPVSGLDFMTEYRWYVNVTDGTYWKHKVYSFQTEPLMIFNPFDEGWQYRKNITIDHTKVVEDLQNFPMLISITDTDLRDKAQADGDDILFMDGAGVATRLYHEIEQFNEGSGELVAWANISFLSADVDTVLYMYYGNPSASNQALPQKLWDKGYTHVWHMDGTEDSTSNNHDLTNHGAGTTPSGKIGIAYDFEKSESDYLTYGDNSISHSKPMCMELWFNMESEASGDYYGMVSMRDQYAIDLAYRKNAYTTVPDRCIFGAYKDINTGWQRYDTGENSISTNTWYYIAYTVDSSGNAQIFFDGIGKENSSGLGDAESTDWESGIGAYFSSSISAHFDGIIDEVRISDVSRSAEWISSSYNNMNDPSGFSVVGPEETGP